MVRILKDHKLADELVRGKKRAAKFTRERVVAPIENTLEELLS